MASGKTTWVQQNRIWLLNWMIDRPSDVLPPLKDIGALLPNKTDSHGAWEALRGLRRQRRISWRSGTPSCARGHQAVMLIPSGRVLKTAGCPFDPPS